MWGTRPSNDLDARLVTWADPIRSIWFSDASLDNPGDQEPDIRLLTLSYDNPGILIRQILKKFDQLPHLHRDLTAKTFTWVGNSSA